MGRAEAHDQRLPTVIITIEEPLLLTGVRARLAPAALYASLVIPSLAQVHKYSGAWGLGAYALASALALRWWPRPDVDRRTARRRALAASLVVAVLFFVAFPIANSGRFGPGSDTDEAYDLAVDALLTGRYPYEVETSLGNRVHHLPGALLLATPFVLLGSSAYQSLFWLPLFFVVARRELADEGEALALYLAVLVLSPVVLQQVVTGNDGVANGLSVLVTTWWVARSRSARARVVATAFLVLAVSNRPNFVLALLPLGMFLGTRDGWRSACVWAAGVGLGLAALNLPFLLYDPPAFAPLEGANRVSRFQDLLPYSGVVLPLAGGAMAAALSVRVRTLRGVFAVAAATQAFFVMAGLGLSSLQAGRLDLSYAGYGTFFLFFGALAAWPAARA